MSLSDWVTGAFLIAACVFFVAGTAGVLRFPDTLSRLHAVTKADNLGLGLLVAGLAVQAGDPLAVLKLVVLWLLALLASATACYVVARSTATDVPSGKRGDGS